ncbi:MAG: hypothetical protein HYV60_22360 [Planctomycetia bacterium]|nr:hypothetical protein [Planctomycetia bacterium]
MNVRHMVCLLGLFGLWTIGCSEPPGSSQIVEQTVTVMTFEGQEKVVSLTELYDAKSGEPAFRSVLAIDRHRNRKAFVPLVELGSESQANARYLPVTSSPAGVPAPGASSE